MKLVDEQIGEFPIRVGSLCRVSLRAYKGRQRVDLRTYYESEDGTYQPTQKGVNIAVDDLPALRRLIVDAERLAVEAGLIDPADYEA